MNLSVFNPWWTEKQVPDELSPIFKRSIFKEVQELIKERQIIALCGLRRTGKTTIFYQIIQHLIETGTKPEDILYFSFDQSITELDNIVNEYLSLFAKDLRKDKIFIFFDEIQKLEDWQNKLKIIYDLYPKLKIFISGSASLKIEKRGKESLAGRLYFIYVKPLSFKEFLELKNIKIEKPYSIYESRAKPLLQEYLKKAMPEIVNSSDLIAAKYIKENIIDRVIFKDIVEEFKDAEHQLLQTLLEIFYSNPGEILNIESLAKELKRRKSTISNHIFYLEFSMLIKIVRNYRGSKHSASRKLPKVYPYHPVLCAYLDVKISKLMENLIISATDASFYWRDGKKEVDAVVDKIPIEVKYRRKIRESDLENVRYFIDKFKSEKGYLITIFEAKTIDKIHEVPAWLFLLEFS